MRPFGCPLCGLNDRRSILAQVIAWKNLGLSYPLANLEAVVATTRGRGVFIVVRVWTVLSALLGCVEVGAGVVLLVVGLVLVFHLGTVELLGPFRLRGCCTGDTIKALLGMFLVTLRSKASIVVHVKPSFIERK